MPRPQRPYLVSDHPLFFAHRGGSLLAPENTLAAFDLGASLGADALELDIQTTAEGELVVTHDPVVDRTTDGNGPVSSFTLHALRRLDAGYRFTLDGGQTYPFRGQGLSIPTLREVFARYPTLRINMDLKESSPEREKSLWRLIQEFEARDRVLVAAETLAPIARFRALSEGRVATSACEPEIRAFVLATYARLTRFSRPAYDALQIPEIYGRVRVTSPTLVRAAHRKGLAVHVWTVDDRPTMDRLLSWGVDGLMSDRPDLLKESLAALANAATSAR
jgi:glycerophosphoryl diester phosphodiesterase